MTIFLDHDPKTVLIPMCALDFLNEHDFHHDFPVDLATLPSTAYPTLRYPRLWIQWQSLTNLDYFTLYILVIWRHFADSHSSIFQAKLERIQFYG